MCLNLRNIFNKSKYIDYKHGDKLYMQVPCGECPECIDQRVNAYLCRMDAELRETNKKHGLAYIDCLTWNDENLTLLSSDLQLIPNNGEHYDENHVYSKGIPVFNLRHVRLAMLRLRTALERAGFYDLRYVPQYDMEGNVSYKVRKIVNIKHFISFEYGGQWHRPHAHCAFFVLHDIDAVTFEKILQKAWKYGNLDYYKKVPDQFSPSGFRTVPKLPEDKVIKSPSGMAYICKYVVKDDDYISFLTSALVDQFPPVDFGLDNNLVINRDRQKYLKKLLGDRVYKTIFPRALISNGFGISLADKYIVENGVTKYNRDYIFMYENGCIEVKNDQGVVTNICLIPQYIQRKLWYELVKAPDFSDVWQLNEEGLQYKLNRLTKSIELITGRYLDIINNIGEFYKNPTDEDNLKRKNEIYKLLNGRSLEDFVVYKSVYKHRLYSDFSQIDMDIYSTISENARRYSDINYDFNDTLNLDSMTKRVRAMAIAYLKNHHRVTELSSEEFTDFDKLDDVFAGYESYKSESVTKIRRDNYEKKKHEKLLNPVYLQHELNNLNHRASILAQVKNLRAYGN